MRQTPYACARFAFIFYKVYEFQAGETLTQRYRLVIANGVAGMRGRRRLWLRPDGMREAEMDEALESLTKSVYGSAVS